MLDTDSSSNASSDSHSDSDAKEEKGEMAKTDSSSGSDSVSDAEEEDGAKDPPAEEGPPADAEEDLAEKAEGPPAEVEDKPVVEKEYIGVSDIKRLLEHTKSKGKLSIAVKHLANMADQCFPFCHPKSMKGKFITLSALKEAASLVPGADVAAFFEI